MRSDAIDDAGVMGEDEDLPLPFFLLLLQNLSEVVGDSGRLGLGCLVVVVEEEGVVVLPVLFPQLPVQLSGSALQLSHVGLDFVLVKDDVNVVLRRKGLEEFIFEPTKHAGFLEQEREFGLVAAPRVVEDLLPAADPPHPSLAVAKGEPRASAQAREEVGTDEIHLRPELVRPRQHGCSSQQHSMFRLPTESGDHLVSHCLGVLDHVGLVENDGSEAAILEAFSEFVAGDDDGLAIAGMREFVAAAVQDKDFVDADGAALVLKGVPPVWFNGGRSEDDSGSDAECAIVSEDAECGVSFPEAHVVSEKKTAFLVDGSGNGDLLMWVEELAESGVDGGESGDWLEFGAAWDPGSRC